MHITIISSYYGEEVGGADISTKLLVDGLINKGITVNIINLKPTFLILKRFLLNTNFYDYFLKKHIKNRIKTTDLIHVNDLMQLPASVEVAKELNIPIVVTVRDYRFISNMPLLDVENNLIKKITKKQSIKLLKKQTQLAYLIYPFIKNKPKKIRDALNKCDKIISISNFIKNNLINNNIKKEDITTIFNPAPNWKQIKQKQHKETILFAPGRLEQYKGFHILINSIKDIIKVYTNFKLIITGTGDYEKQLKDLTNKLNLNNYITFTGKIPYNKIKDYYFNSDIVILPSIWPESMGRIQLETITSSKPIIASNIGGIPEIVTNQIGILVKPNDKEELTKAILKLIKDKKLRLKLGKEANRLYNEFSQEKFIEKMIDVYNHLKYS